MNKYKKRKNYGVKYCKGNSFSPFLDYTLYILHENIYTFMSIKYLWYILLT